MGLIERDQGWTISVCWYCGRAEHAAVDPCDCTFDAAPKRMLSVAVRPADTPGAVGTPEERIAEVLHFIGFGAERHEIARQMLRFAQDFGGR